MVFILFLTLKTLTLVYMMKLILCNNLFQYAFKLKSYIDIFL